MKFNDFALKQPKETLQSNLMNSSTKRLNREEKTCTKNIAVYGVVNTNRIIQVLALPSTCEMRCI